MKQRLLWIGLCLVGGIALAFGFLVCLGGEARAAATSPASALTTFQVCSSGCVYTSVQSAVDAAPSDAIIQIAGGVYTAVYTRQGLQQMAYITKSLVLRGGYSPDFSARDMAAYPTTLDAGNRGRVIAIVGAVQVTLEGLGIVHGSGGNAGGCAFNNVDSGGGVFIRDAVVVISATLVASNTATTVYNHQACGGGLYAENANLVVTHSTIQGNRSGTPNSHYTWGGGSFLKGTQAFFTDNVIWDNQAGHSGYVGDGGAFYITGGVVELERNYIYNNRTQGGGGSGSGAGVYAYITALTMRNNTILSNTVMGGISGGYGGGVFWRGSVNLLGNLFISNTAAYGGGVYGQSDSTSLLANNVFKANQASIDEYSNGLGNAAYITSNKAVKFIHNTFVCNLGGDGSAVYLRSNPAEFTNNIFAANKIAVRKSDGTFNVSLLRTLWDSNITNTVNEGRGSLVEAESIAASAAFAADGYHLTKNSAAVDAGAPTSIVDDVDGDLRPRGAAPDIGADESPYGQAAGPGVILEKRAYSPVWVYRPAQIGGGYLKLNFLVRLVYGASAKQKPPLVSYALQDLLPQDLELLYYKTSPGLSFTRQGNDLNWHSSGKLEAGQTAWVEIAALSRAAPGVVYTNQASAAFSPSPTQTLFLSVSTTSPVELLPPKISFPGSGEICAGELTVKGIAQPGVEVTLYEAGQSVGSVIANQEGRFNYSYTPLQAGVYTGTTVMTATASAHGQVSEPSQPVRLTASQSFWCPQRSYWANASAAYIPLSFRNSNGSFSTSGWDLRGSMHVILHIHACTCPKSSEAPRNMRVRIGGSVFTDSNGPSGAEWVFDIFVKSLGEGSIEAECRNEYDEWEWRSVSGRMKLIDPDGFVFDVTRGFDPQQPGLTALSGVTVTCMVSAPEWGGWTPWPAGVYSQTNPQNTSSSYPDGIFTEGYFAFFTPPGLYYLQVEGPPGYQPWRSPLIAVITQVVHVNVPLTPWGGRSAAQVLLGAAAPGVITVTAGTVVNWLAPIDSAAVITDVLRLAENPIFRLLSSGAFNPLANPLGFDSGMLAPGQSYQRRFTRPGIYAYTDGAGRAGQVVVTNYRLLLPVVKR